MFISTAEAMKLLCLKSRNQLYRLKDEGKIIAYKPAGRVLFNRDELIEYVKNAKVKPKPPPEHFTAGKKRKGKFCSAGKTPKEIRAWLNS